MSENLDTDSFKKASFFIAHTIKGTPISEKKTPFAIKKFLPLISILLVPAPISKPSLIFLRVFGFLRNISKDGLK